jgi:hypothetical protein
MREPLHATHYAGEEDCICRKRLARHREFPNGFVRSGAWNKRWQRSEIYPGAFFHLKETKHLNRRFVLQKVKIRDSFWSGRRRPESSSTL